MSSEENKKRISANIIFDIGGVLFQSYCKFPAAKEYIPLERGIEMLKKCYAQQNEQGKKLHNLYILSNWKAPNFHALTQEYSSIFNLFDGVVISGNLQFAKPDRRIYEHFLEQFQLEAKDCVFIDDLLENVQAAECVGIKGVHCENFDVVEQQLITMNLL